MSPGGAGGGSQPLAEMLVQFSAKGLEQLTAAFTGVKAQLDALTATVAAMDSRLTQGLAQVAAGVQANVKATEDFHRSFVQAAGDIQAAVGAVVLAVQKVGVQMAGMAGQAKAKTDEAAKAVVDLAGAWQKAGAVINVTLAAATASVAGFVRQGMAAGIQGQFFQIALERLSLAMSGLFRPELEKLLGLIDRVTSYLSSLTDAQRGNLARWIEGAAAASALGLILPRVLGGVQALVGGFRALQAAITGTLSSTGIGALIPLLGLAVEGMTALLVGTKGGRAALERLSEPVAALGKALADLGQQIQLNEKLEEAGRAMGELVSATANLVAELVRVNAQLDRLGLGLKSGLQGGKFLWETIGGGNAFMKWLAGPEPPKKPEEPRGPDIRRAGGFEDLGATYRRITLASSRIGGGKPPDEETAENTRKAAELLDLIKRAIENPRPEIAR